MKPLGDNRRGDPLGIALSLTEIVAYDSRLAAVAGPLWRMTLEMPNPESAVWPSLATALRTLAELTGEEQGTLAVALLAPAAETRRVEVPPLPDDELEGFLSRSAARYFVGARGTQLVGVTSGQAKRQAGQGTVAAAVPAWFVRLVTAAVRDAGWTLQHMVPAEAAWGAAAARAWPASIREDAVVLVHHHDRTDVLQLHKGTLGNVRRFRAAAADVPVLLEALPSAPGLLSFGNSAARKEWLAALQARSLNVSLPTALPVDVANDATVVAAAFATDVETLFFRTDEMRAADRKRRSRVMWTMVAAAVVLVAASAEFMLWDVQRELAAVQAARVALKPQLATTVVGRTSVETVSGQLQMLATAERESPHWSLVIADLTEHLPDDAYLTGLRGRSDSVVFDGLATHAASVFPAVEKVQSFAGVKAAAPVRREAGNGDGETMERFTLAARLRLNTVTRSPVPPRAAASAPSREKGAP